MEVSPMPCMIHKSWKICGYLLCYLPFHMQQYVLPTSVCKKQKRGDYVEQRNSWTQILEHLTFCISYRPVWWREDVLFEDLKEGLRAVIVINVSVSSPDLILSTPFDCWAVFAAHCLCFRRMCRFSESSEPYRLSQLWCGHAYFRSISHAFLRCRLRLGLLVLVWAQALFEFLVVVLMLAPEEANCSKMEASSASSCTLFACSFWFFPCGFDSDGCFEHKIDDKHIFFLAIMDLESPSTFSWAASAFNSGDGKEWFSTMIFRYLPTWQRRRNINSPAFARCACIPTHLPFCEIQTVWILMCCSCAVVLVLSCVFFLHLIVVSHCLAFVELCFVLVLSCL